MDDFLGKRSPTQRGAGAPHHVLITLAIVGTSTSTALALSCERDPVTNPRSKRKRRWFLSVLMTIKCELIVRN